MSSLRVYTALPLSLAAIYFAGVAARACPLPWSKPMCVCVCVRVQCTFICPLPFSIFISYRC